MKCFLKLMSVVVVAVFAAYPAFATQPGQTVNPNGFPSGDHYNLNIIGKKSGFNCPGQQYDLSGNLVSGNVIYVPGDRDRHQDHDAVRGRSQRPRPSPTSR